MTLVTRPKPPAHHKKTVGKHHRLSKTYHKPYWPYLPVIAIVIVGVILSNSSWVTRHTGVLAYATDVSIQGLLDNTNTQRINNGLSALALNGVLDNAAQAKANDMAARDYWSHNTPDGKTPWTFMDAAGYKYQLAGENLAYGFTTSSDTLTGWMNSPGHRANILNGGYTEVGFGYINIANYQGTGPETLVVAMYAAPASMAVQAATPAPVAVQKTTTVQAAAAASSNAGAATAATPTPAAEPTPAETPTATTPATPASDTVVATTTPLKDVSEPSEQHVTRSQLLTAGKAPWSGLAIGLIGAGAIVLFLFRHAVAWHKFVRRGEKFILHHPIFDSAVVAIAVLAIMFSFSAGVIR